MNENLNSIVMAVDKVSFEKYVENIKCSTKRPANSDNVSDEGNLI